jgi:hypothetical protein
VDLLTELGDIRHRRLVLPPSAKCHIHEGCAPSGGDSSRVLVNLRDLTATNKAEGNDVSLVQEHI